MQERLKLEISEEKTRIVNAKYTYVDIREVENLYILSVMYLQVLLSLKLEEYIGTLQREEVHRLLHATKMETIKKYRVLAKLTNAELVKINKLRAKLEIDPIIATVSLTQTYPTTRFI